jgi:hypothetical protein
MSFHADRMRSFRPSISRTRFSRSLGIGLSRNNSGWPPPSWLGAGDRRGPGAVDHEAKIRRPACWGNNEASGPFRLTGRRGDRASVSCANWDHGRRSANYSDRRLGFGCGANVASIIRRWLAPSLSFGGSRTLQVTGCALVHAAPVAAAKARPFSVQAGPAIASASIRFRRASPTTADSRRMSASPPKADIGEACRDVRFVPKADILRCSKKCRYSITWSSLTFIKRLWNCRTRGHNRQADTDGGWIVLVPDYIAIGVLIVLIVWAVADWVPRGKL